ncbi:MAG: glycosyltransferase [Clostridiales bacterium]|nr:glycosyltransferase [Clostridiales bacterium]
MTIPELSIITVCYEAKSELLTTLNNILQQSWKHFEYLVIDGDSKDGTKELLAQYEDKFSQNGISFRYVSEPDHGIYDAMNKGTRLATGNWLLFLNAGDLLADDSVLWQIFNHPSPAQIVYGDTLCIYQGNKKLYPALPLEHLTYEMSFCHQSVFIRRELMLRHPYDISYKICADHHFFLSMYLQKKIFDYRPIPISIYEIAGYSDKNKMTAHKEKQRMQKELGVFKITLTWLLREISFYCKQFIKTAFGQGIIDKVRKNRLR